MTKVQVNDAEEKSLGKIVVGDTKQEALQRLGGLKGDGGGLFDKNDLGLLDSDLITEDAAPYVFKPSVQQQQQQQQPQNDPAITVEFKYKTSSKRVEIHKSTLNFGWLENTVRDLWPEDFATAAFKLNAEGLLSDDTDLAKLPDPLKALDYAKVDRVAINPAEFPTATEIDNDNEWLQHATKDLKQKHKLFGALTEGCESTRREFISSVLVLAATIAEVMLSVEEMIEGSLGQGPVDWVALYNSYRICITEGKKDALAQGVDQNIAQLAASREDKNKKRKFSVDLPSFGIATTYTEWVFLKLVYGVGENQQRALFRSTASSIQITEDDLEGSVRKVAGQIAAIFKFQKDLVDELATKRPKTDSE